MTSEDTAPGTQIICLTLTMTHARPSALSDRLCAINGETPSNGPNYLGLRYLLAFAHNIAFHPLFIAGIRSTVGIILSKSSHLQASHAILWSDNGSSVWIERRLLHEVKASVLEQPNNFKGDCRRSC